MKLKLSEEDIDYPQNCEKDGIWVLKKCKNCVSSG